MIILLKMQLGKITLGISILLLILVTIGITAGVSLTTWGGWTIVFLLLGIILGFTQNIKENKLIYILILITVVFYVIAKFLGESILATPSLGNFIVALISNSTSFLWPAVLILVIRKLVSK